jgi:hypothetical protein
MSMSDDDFEKLRRELVFDQVSKAIKENHKNWTSKLKELGFESFGVIFPAACGGVVYFVE